MFVLLITELGNDIMNKKYRQPDKLEFGGESPLTSRDERGLFSFPAF